MSGPPALNLSLAPKMTANAPPEGKWSCEVCTYENFPLSRKCTMCLSPCPVLSPCPPPSPRASSPDNASAPAPALGAVGAGAVDAQTDLSPSLACAVGEADGVTDRLRPLRIAEPRGQPKWPCQTCTYENWPRAQRCAMCGGAPPTPNGPAPAPAPGAVSPPLPAPATPAHQTADKQNNGGAEWQPQSEERRKRRTNGDWLWLQACIGVVENRMSAVQAYLSMGGEPTRALTHQECQRLGRPSAFDQGYTLVHLAIRFHRSEILSVVLSRIGGGGPGLKRSPSFAAPDIAGQLRRLAANSVRAPQHQHHHPVPHLADWPTFTLPPEMESLPPAVQEQLFSELLDRDSQQQLEEDPPAINWAHEVTVRLGSRLYALWNRSLGDCLPDALSQCLYGVFDRVGWVRRALADALTGSGSRALYSRWAHWERQQAELAHYCPTETQLRSEWSRLVSAASRTGCPLAQLHVFALAQVVRRPLLVYGVRVVRSFRGDPIGYARFQGLYLPLLWEPEQCSKSPLVLGYTRGHFSALVALEPPPRRYILNSGPERAVFLPLVECGGEPLSVPFALPAEPSEAPLAAQWLHIRDVAGVPCARVTLPQRPLLVAQMLEEWLNHYRRIAQQTRGPFPPRLVTDYCSDNDGDNE